MCICLPQVGVGKTRLNPHNGPGQPCPRYYGSPNKIVTHPCQANPGPKQNAFCPSQHGSGKTLTLPTSVVPRNNLHLRGIEVSNLKLDGDTTKSPRPRPFPLEPNPLGLGVGTGQGEPGFWVFQELTHGLSISTLMGQYPMCMLFP